MGLNKEIKVGIERLRKGDMSGFSVVYKAYAPGLFRFLMLKTRGNQPLCEDILQEVFVRFLKKVSSLKTMCYRSIASYLLRIAHHCLLDRYRGLENKIPHISLEKACGVSISSSVEEQFEAKKVTEHIKGLKAKQARIIWLRDALGYSHRDIARELRISEPDSRQTYRRAKKVLLDSIGGENNYV